MYLVVKFLWITELSNNLSTAKRHNNFMDSLLDINNVSLFQYVKHISAKVMLQISGENLRNSQIVHKVQFSQSPVSWLRIC